MTLHGREMKALRLPGWISCQRFWTVFWASGSVMS
jgi:hypothetical protein